MADTLVLLPSPAVAHSLRQLTRRGLGPHGGTVRMSRGSSVAKTVRLHPRSGKLKKISRENAAAFLLDKGFDAIRDLAPPQFSARARKFLHAAGFTLAKAAKKSAKKAAKKTAKKTTKRAPKKTAKKTAKKAATKKRAAKKEASSAAKGARRAESSAKKAASKKRSKAAKRSAKAAEKHATKAKSASKAAQKAKTPKTARKHARKAKSEEKKAQKSAAAARKAPKVTSPDGTGAKTGKRGRRGGKRKFSPAQLEAQRKFAERAKAGKLGKGKRGGKRRSSKK